MKQLSGLDANFLYMETPTSFGHVNSLVVYERPDDPDFNPYLAYKAQFERRIHLLDPFRRKLAQVPFGLDHPYWINDPDFDIDFHIRHIAIPPPGDIHQLGEQVARIIGRPLDRSRPLWEVYVLEGLDDGDFGVLMKVHHSTIDGASGVELLHTLLDASPSGDDVEPDTGTWRPDAIPTDLDLLSRTFASYVRRPGKLMRVQLNAMQQLAEITKAKGLATMIDSTRRQLPKSLGGTPAQDDEVAGLGLTAPRTPFNKNVTAHRKLAMASAKLADIKALKNALNATVNDVVMAVSAGALRRYLEKHGALPDEPLRALVPVSIRTGEEEDPWTNRVSAMTVELPTTEDDPLVRVQKVHEAMIEAKEQFELVPAEVLVDMAEFNLPAVAVGASRAASSLRIADRTRPPVNVVISNVPGPRTPLYMAGATMKHFYPVSTVAHGMGLNITVQSYLDTLDFGLVACRELVPDLSDLLELHLDEIQVLFDAAGLDRP